MKSTYLPLTFSSYNLQKYEDFHILIMDIAISSDYNAMELVLNDMITELNDFDTAGIHSFIIYNSSFYSPVELHLKISSALLRSRNILHYSIGYIERHKKENKPLSLNDTTFEIFDLVLSYMALDTFKEAWFIKSDIEFPQNFIENILAQDIKYFLNIGGGCCDENESMKIFTPYQMYANAIDKVDYFNIDCSNFQSFYCFELSEVHSYVLSSERASTLLSRRNQINMDADEAELFNLIIYKASIKQSIITVNKW